MRPAAIAAPLLALLAACSPAKTNAVDAAVAAGGKVSHIGGFGFEVVFPATPEVSQGLEANPTSFSEDVTVAGDNFAVAASDYKAAPKPIDDLAQQLAALVIQRDGGVITSDAAVANGRWTGREIHISKDGQQAIVLRAFLANGRLYEVGATTNSGAGDPAVSRFLNSFTLLDPPTQ